MAVLEYSKELQVQTAAGAERESMLWSVYTSTKMSINTNIAAICMTVTRRSSSFLRDDRYRHFNNLLPHSSMSTFPFLYLFRSFSLFAFCLQSSTSSREISWSVALSHLDLIVLMCMGPCTEIPLLLYHFKFNCCIRCLNFILWCTVLEFYARYWLAPIVYCKVLEFTRQFQRTTISKVDSLSYPFTEFVIN